MAELNDIQSYVGEKLDQYNPSLGTLHQYYNIDTEIEEALEVISEAPELNRFKKRLLRFQQNNVRPFRVLVTILSDCNRHIRNQYEESE